MKQKIKTMVNHHTDLMEAMIKAKVTVDDLGRAMASLEGKRKEYDLGRMSPEDDLTRHYQSYLSEAEEMVERATFYAKDRKKNK